MTSIVVTGGTRGIGYGLAREFLQRGHQVTICGRSVGSTQAAVGKLAQQFGSDRVVGQPCDVTKIQELQELWDLGYKQFGKIDIWINNAGVTTSRKNLWELDVEELEQVVQTNLLGVMLASKVAVAGMLKQGHGQLYNMEGLGSSGPVVEGLGPYASTKAGLTVLTKTLIKETKELPIQVCYLSPGMVITDLYTGKNNENLDDKSTKRMANILADKEETVTPYLVEKILANKTHGKRINWLTGGKIAWRFLTAPFNKRDLFAEESTSSSHE